MNNKAIKQTVVDNLIDLNKYRIIDLTLTVVSADSWIQFPRKLVKGAMEPPTKIEPISTIKEHGVFVNYIETTTQSFTHYDAPIHFDENGLANDEVPLEQLMGEAVVIDMMHKRPGEGVTATDLEASGIEVKPGDIAIIRTGWTDRAWGTREFWEKMIYLTEDACDWLIKKRIKALAQDFMTDLAPLHRCEVCGQLTPVRKDIPGQPEPERSHIKFLKENGILLIEWLTNLGKIKKPRVFFICLPMKLKGTDGAPARVIALEEKT